LFISNNEFSKGPIALETFKPFKSSKPDCSELPSIYEIINSTQTTTTTKIVGHRRFVDLASNPEIRAEIDARNVLVPPLSNPSSLFFAPQPNGLTLFYKGELKDRKAHGQGEGFWPDGVRAYKGAYENGKMHGQGEQFWPGGKLFYKGAFENGKPHGQGEQFWSDGVLFYKGAFENGKPHGQGEIFWPDGVLFHKGAFENGKPHGQGEQSWSDGVLFYKGAFENGKRAQ